MTRPARSTLAVSFVCLTALLFSLMMAPAGCGRAGSIELEVICAGSLMVPFQAAEKAYEAEHPGVDVLIEGHGSIQVIRQVTELHREADIIAVADCSLIPLLMYDLPADNGQPYADWMILFASNRLGIASTPESLYSQDLNAQNWLQILSRPEVQFGLSDPRFDSLGYRALMVIKLAESYYGDDGIFDELVGSSFDPPIAAAEQNGTEVISVPELVRPSADRISLRGYSVQLLALLQAGEIDYAFEYQSVARQFGLQFLELPEPIDLSSEVYSADYSKVSVRLDFQRFSSVKPEFTGQPIIYGITIPTNAPHHEEAVSFLEFLLGPEGQQTLEQNYQPPIVPAEADNTAGVPVGLRALLK
jgi:molybdate/tungstate transport system substrate-binding protein